MGSSSTKRDLGILFVYLAANGGIDCRAHGFNGVALSFS